jgi:GH25 family lysozyme M1 (1,4-beta-N-acetylmuramidase)
MGLKFSSFATKGVDVSQFNGTIDWAKIMADFSGIRVGYGHTIDTKFVENWLNSKGKVNRIPYWYMDYYSNHIQGWAGFGMEDNAFGSKQADICHGALKNDMEGAVFLDIENGNPKYAPALSTVSNRALAIAKGFLQHLDELNGKSNGIYCSIGLLTWFDDWFKDRPLWVAWYDEKQSISSVIKAVRATGWRGPVCIWQYASDGDMDDDGVGDGVAMGTKVMTLDLNALAITISQYSSLFGGWKVVQNVPVDQPDDEAPVVVDPAKTGSYKVKSIPWVNAREKPDVAARKLTTLTTGTPVEVKEVVNGPGSEKGWGRVEVFVAIDCLKKV